MSYEGRRFLHQLALILMCVMGFMLMLSRRGKSVVGVKRGMADALHAWH